MKKIAFELYRDGIFCLPRTIDGSQFCGAEQRQARSGLREESEKSHHLEELPVKLRENYLEIERVHGSGKGNAVAIFFSCGTFLPLIMACRCRGRCNFVVLLLKRSSNILL